MSEPTTEDVRSACARYLGAEEFDRWIAAHHRRIQADLLRTLADKYGTFGADEKDPILKMNYTTINAILTAEAIHIEKGES